MTDEQETENPSTSRWFRIAIAIVLITLPLVIGWWYRSFTRLPAAITIATGPVDGRYRQVGSDLAEALRGRLEGVRVEIRPTTGSVENLRLLRAGEVDLAIVQADVGFATSETPSDPAQGVAFVANLYSEVVHFVVRQGIDVETPDDLRGRSIAIGPEDSGDRGTSLLLLEHLGLSLDDVRARDDDYAAIRRGFEAGTLDAAIVTSSPRSPVLDALLIDGRCDLVAVPFAEALATRRLAVVPHRIPAGFYRSRPPVEPRTDVQTVAVRAQLLCRARAGNRLIAEVTRTVTSRSFVKRNELSELYFGEVEFAREKPAFNIHSAAAHVYDPAMEPLLDPNFVEATEGIRSFAVSLLIGLYLLYRWIRDRRIRWEEHALDDFIRRLLEIERRQLAMDENPAVDDLGALQHLLDEVTRLRQDALHDFSAHSLREDRATDTFLEMCHALSDKINAKISRQRLDRRFDELRRVLDALADGRPRSVAETPVPEPTTAAPTTDREPS